VAFEKYCWIIWYSQTGHIG